MDRYDFIARIRTGPIATFLVMVDDPRSPIRRYYGPFATSEQAEAYAAPRRVKFIPDIGVRRYDQRTQVHAVVQPLWIP